ncbi:MAG: caspase family protein, partial [Hyphomicrobiales bacterium]|nr:caspase family protein [Hyphomicrobiales bacterium]
MQPQRLSCRLMATGLMALAMLVVVLQPGFAQSGKRLAFVVGLADYGATQHPTALGDAGLVAQTLKGAGFEVTEAANLNQGEFRTLFRDF